MAQWLMNPTRNHGVAGLIPGHTQWVRIQRCRELWCRLQMQLGAGWLWLWRRPAAPAPIRPLAWEPPHATSAALKSKKKKK